MHLTDVARLGLCAGARVRVHNHVGSVVARLESTPDVMPGVVSLPHGFGHQRAAATMRVAGKLTGASVNALTDDAWVEPVLGDSILNGVPVSVSALTEEPG